MWEDPSYGWLCASQGAAGCVMTSRDWLAAKLEYYGAATYAVVVAGDILEKILRGRGEMSIVGSGTREKWCGDDCEASGEAEISDFRRYCIAW